MGRPLKKETIEKMNLIVKTKDSQAVLGKQVGYNKYIVDEDNHKIVRLAKEAINEDDAVLEVQVNGEAKPVLKVLRNLIQTEEGVYSYRLETEMVDTQEVTKVVFDDAHVTFEAPATQMATPKRTTNKPTQPTEPEVTEPEVEEPTTEPETTDEE